MEESKAERKAGKKEVGKSSGQATKFIYLNNISHTLAQPQVTWVFCPVIL
jgi:hypothetical protein